MSEILKLKEEVKEMKGILIAAGVILALVLFVGLPILSMYNGMVTADNAVDKAWADVQAVYQRRADVIPQIAKVAKFSVEIQYKLNTEVAKLREGYANASTPSAIEQVDQATVQILVNARAEAVPQLDTAQLTELNAVIDSVERAINHQRDAYNEAVRVFNNKVEKLPGKWFAAGWGFYPKESFKARSGAEVPPEIDLELD